VATSDLGGRLVDDHEGNASLAQLAGYLGPDPPEATEHVVALKVFDLHVHPPRVEPGAKVALEGFLDGQRERVEGGADTQEDERHREELVHGVEWPKFPEADGAERGDRLVEGVNERHPRQGHVTGGADYDDRAQQQQGCRKAWAKRDKQPGGPVHRWIV